VSASVKQQTKERNPKPQVDRFKRKEEEKRTGHTRYNPTNPRKHAQALGQEAGEEIPGKRGDECEHEESEFGDPTSGVLVIFRMEGIEEGACDEVLGPDHRHGPNAETATHACEAKTCELSSEDEHDVKAVPSFVLWVWEGGRGVRVIYLKETEVDLLQAIPDLQPSILRRQTRDRDSGGGGGGGGRRGRWQR
jgi:hypothetical protein